MLTPPPRSTFLALTGLVLTGLVLTGCQTTLDEECDPAPPTPYSVALPYGFPEQPVSAHNPTTVEGVALGRQLYYDRRTSPDGSRACADCHLQERSFTNPEVHGVLPHINLAWSTTFLWDGGYEGTLEEVMLLELVDFFESDVERLKEPDLEAMFLAAFGSPTVSLERAADALAQFQRTMVSGGSRFDRHMAGEINALTEAERRGMYLFYYGERGQCFQCHASVLFTDNDFHNIGLLDEASIAGAGRGGVTGLPEDDGAFKTPTLRNVAMTAPYMHDDRFESLEQVVQHYSDGIQGSRTLDPLLPPGGYGYSPQEVADLVAFLGALSDEDYVTNPDLAAPE
jgi:cytochrome c peroxidase